ncbi:MAG: EAL domain-containing protein [Treponemataceae bacterium]|nr:EAL domain-containing protein [Treponemataceae bacterium]
MKEKSSKKSNLPHGRIETVAGICVSIVAIAIVIIGIFVVAELYITKNNVREFYSKICDDLVARHADYMEHFLKDYFDDLDEFANAEELKSGDAKRAVDFLREKNPVMRIHVNDIFYATNDGKAVSILGQEVDISGTEFSENIIQTEEPYIISLFDLESFSENEYAIAKNVLGSNGEIVATVFYALRLETIESPVSGMNLSDMFFGFAINEDGEFIIPINHESILNRTNEFLDEEEIYLKSTFLKKISDTTEGSFIFKIKNYPDEFVVWKKILQTDWIIAVAAPLNRIDSSTAVFKNRIIIICALFVFFVIAVAASVFIVFFKQISSHRLTLQETGEIDELTGLWTEFHFEEEAEKLFKKNPNQNYMILGLDIRGFRIVQQTEGVACANEQLILLSRRLGEIAREKNGIVARGHIDHFYLMYPISDSESALRDFDSLLYNGNFLEGRAGELVPTKAGIVFAGKDYEKNTIQNLIGKTNYAKHMVQDNLLKNYSVYNSNMETRILSEKRIERYIPIAFTNNEFYVVYQPKINLSDGKIIGAEALVRWKSAKLGDITPDNFIPLFERNGYINHLDFYVYQKVFEFMKARIAEGENKLVPISMNMSRFHLNDEKFVLKFSELFDKYNIPPQMIEVEILERSLGVADDRAREVAKQLHEKGFRVAIDDFGTGESSLSLISKIPADILKLDRKFMLGVQDASSSSDDEFKIVRQIVEMARQLGKETICEGVETEEQINFLRSIKCNYVQGFFYSKPLSEKEFVEYLEQHL